MVVDILILLGLGHSSRLVTRSSTFGLCLVMGVCIPNFFAGLSFFRGLLGCEAGREATGELRPFLSIQSGTQIIYSVINLHLHR